MTGTPAEQCLSEKEKRREKRKAKQRQHAELWDQIRKSDNPNEAWRRAFPIPRPKVHQDGNVIDGPWQEGA